MSSETEIRYPLGCAPGKLSRAVNDNSDNLAPELNPITPSINPKSPEGSVKNTNSSLVHLQSGKICYSHAATSAYINTCMRIYSCKPPTFNDALQIAKYSENGGQPYHSLELLEKHYKNGICFQKTKCCQIRDILVTSVIMSFSTSKEGWKMISAGSILTKPSGKPEGRHAALLEGYNLQDDHIWAKNSWGAGGINHTGRFAVNWFMLEDVEFVQVYFTIESIQKTLKFEPLLVRQSREYSVPPAGVSFNQTNEPIPQLKCVFLDEQTSIYCSEWWCLKVNDSPHKEEGLDFIGFLVNDWINYYLRRPVPLPGVSGNLNHK